MPIGRGGKSHRVAVWSSHMQSCKLMSECSWLDGSDWEE